MTRENTVNEREKQPGLKTSDVGEELSEDDRYDDGNVAKRITEIIQSTVVETEITV